MTQTEPNRRNIFVHAIILGLIAAGFFVWGFVNMGEKMGTDEQPAAKQQTEQHG